MSSGFGIASFPHQAGRLVGSASTASVEAIRRDDLDRMVDATGPVTPTCRKVDLPERPEPVTRPQSVCRPALPAHSASTSATAPDRSAFGQIAQQSSFSSA